ncbi:hypothetical protein [Acetobacter malorum]|uniref:hypothetical protein n=1 Tax=Acetobacter malorum TaxID=178901 RepID=UPI00142DB2E3|nr:hypothetical protein [Acetobacter malorum]
MSRTVELAYSISTALQMESYQHPGMSTGEKMKAAVSDHLFYPLAILTHTGPDQKEDLVSFASPLQETMSVVEGGDQTRFSGKALMPCAVITSYLDKAWGHQAKEGGLSYTCTPLGDKEAKLDIVISKGTQPSAAVH